MTSSQLYRIIAPTVTVETTPDQIKQRIRAIEPGLSSDVLWAAHDRLCRLAEDRRRIAGQAEAWEGPPEERYSAFDLKYPGALLGHIAGEPPHSRGRRIVHKPEPMGG